MAEKVNLYIKATSPDTEEIKDYLTTKGIDYEVHDVSADISAHKRMLEATRGACGAPVIEVGHQVVCGFDRDRLDEALGYELR